MARTFDWPDTYKEYGGLMGFQAEYVNYDAGDYKRWLTPKVNALLAELTQQDVLIAELTRKNSELENTISELRNPPAEKPVQKRVPFGTFIPKKK